MKKLTTTTIAIAMPFCAFAHDIPHGHEHVDGGYNAQAGFVSEDDVTAPLFNPRGKSPEVLAARIEFLAEAYDLVRTPEEQACADAAREKYADAIAINSLMPASVGIIDNDEESFTRALRRNMDAGMTLTSGSVYAFPDAIPKGQTAYDVIANSDVIIEEVGAVKIATTEDVRQAKLNGKLGVMYNIQGSDYVADDMKGHAERSYEGGVRTANFVYNANNMLAGGGSAQDMGLTELGRKWVKVAQANGIVIDVSHSSNQTAIEAAEIATKPIIASHSNASGLFETGRNISDEAIKAVASTGGVVCPVGAGLFLNAEGNASPERFVEHVVYIADMIGRDRVCFSTDYVHNYVAFLERDITNVDIYPPELGMGGPASNIAPENIWDIAAILENDHGWTEEDIRGFLGENLMRVYEANWAK
ncbi:dipeptidase [Shimia haliotis]|uniref:Membrane dipeptidase (Peptidase family M19) n=1 Tax=Shimia haliotis TaxID=1280847 RepID=A0A1I4D8G1_9RHOB|nr:membrane dipeptidase [Shimia haliotis]SFK89888.1 Membrane dipeptidase (Peptidase family M19) [Shimia haliotis]